jgi:hypothetical protein
MLDDETTPVKACVDFPFDVNNIGKFSRHCKAIFLTLSYYWYVPPEYIINVLFVDAMSPFLI